MPDSTPTRSAEAHALADLVNGLHLKLKDPERYHVEKDAIARRLRRLAIGLEDLEGRKPSTTWRPDGKRR